MTAESVGQTGENTGSFHAASDGNSAPNFSRSEQVEISRNSAQIPVTGSVTAYKENMSNVGMSENKTEDQPNAVIYLRVSSKKQFEEGHSIPSQDVDCKTYAKLKKYNVAKVFTDEGVSATIHLWNRPAGKAMKKYIEENDIQHIIVVKMDRLFRNVQDLLSTIDELTEKGVGLHILEFRGQTIDTTNSMGRFFLTVIGGMAELESGQISERTKAAMKHIKNSSKRFTGEIYGWDCKGDDLTPNWKEQYLIDYMRDLFYGYDYSGYKISKILNSMGEKGKLGGIWRSSTVMRTINYEFHKNRDKPEFTKPIWWGNAAFTDLIPWGTKSCLNLYATGAIPPVFVKPQPTPAQSVFINATKSPKPVESFSQETNALPPKRQKANPSDSLLNWDEL